MNDDERVTRLRLLRERVVSSLSEVDLAASVVELDQTCTGRVSRMDALQRQAIAIHASRQTAAQLLRIDAALRRWAEGRYGARDDCGEPIDPRRLDADPAAETGMPCATERERARPGTVRPFTSST